MTQPVTDTTREAELLDLHNGFLQGIEAGSPLGELSGTAIRRFETLGFPHKKHEMYTFVNTHDLAATRFALAGEGPVDADFVRGHVYPSCENSVLVMVDGRYHAGLSDLGALGKAVTVTPLAEALREDSLRQGLMDALNHENDAFAALNNAFAPAGCVLDVAAKTPVEVPLQILYVSTGAGSGPVMSCPRLVLRLGTMAELKVIVKFVGRGRNYFVNAVQDIVVGEDAGLTLAQVQADDPEAWHFAKTRVRVARNGRFFSVSASSGCRLARHHAQVHLEAEGAEARLNGAAILVNQEQAHNFLRIHHEAPHCTSHQMFRNVINHQGRSSFDGTVIVNQNAQQTYSDQLINNLMLSDEAHADNKPNLMIFADDVKCAHGATVGQVDPDQLFYLETRGLSPEVARTLLTTSFVESVLQTIPFPEVAADLDRILLKKLEADHG